MSGTVGAFIAAATAIIILGLLVKSSGTPSVIGATGTQVTNIIDALSWQQSQARGAH